MQTVHIVAVITAKPGMRDDLLEAFKNNVPAVLKEDGCIEYFPTIDTVDAGAAQTKYGSNTFVVIEKWESMAALKAHAVSPHMKAYAEKAKDMISDRVIHILSPA